MIEKTVKIDLSTKDFEFICPVKSANMDSVCGGYFCNQCEKKVYDVSNYTHEELHTLKATNSNLCINFKKIVTTTIILNSTICVAFGTSEGNKLSPLTELSPNQSIVFEHKETVELGGGAISPISIFEVEGDIWVPIEPTKLPSNREDENITKGDNCKGFILE